MKFPYARTAGKSVDISLENVIRLYQIMLDIREICQEEELYDVQVNSNAFYIFPHEIDSKSEEEQVLIKMESEWLQMINRELGEDAES